MLRRLLLPLLGVASAAAAQDPEPALLVPPALLEPAAAAPTTSLAPALWSRSALRQLLSAAEAAREEGLRPSDYGRDALADIVAAERTGPAVDAVAEHAARALAHDYADGRVTDRQRFDWHIDHSPAALASLDADLDRAVEGGQVETYLKGLLPSDPRYAALRDALRATPRSDATRIAHIRASMERWRWMPRTLGDDYVLVNVPAYRLALFQGREEVAAHDVVVGAPKTPTPQIVAYAGSIVVNPWWTLPPSVLAEGKRYSAAKGYIYTSTGGRTVIRQRPGPQNALGRMKIDMPNQYAIYLHDTPAKAAFAKTDRALSHGCIRVKDIAGLADELADATQLQSALDGTSTQTLQLQRSVPVYIVYFTAGERDGKVVTFADPYGRDTTLNAALDGNAPTPSSYAAAAT
ncbi:L,D-transpeptidase family protein [Sphingomonas sp.]|uniref:L,D-transpeptidase family protein n=1 Tax=Sphingomonas sp. TaxID=28214 RepID=UPI003B00DA65